MQKSVEKTKSYGISVQFNKNTQILINTKNILTFNILYDVKEENITLQTKNILKQEKIEPLYSKITNFLILSIKKQNTYNRKRKMQRKVTNGLNDAKEILINEKLFQSIAVIYILGRDGWENI